jgi:tripartite ATP-independent transporter DctM subunit
MDVIIVTVLLFGSLIIGLALGFPIAFSLAGIAALFTILMWGTEGLIMIPLNMMGAATNFILTALPLFFFMGKMLEVSGIAEDLYDTFYRWLGRVRGGLAIGTVNVCTIFAAMAGISGAATITMGLIALPSMLKRGYDKSIAMGCVMAGGALGVLIPPSVMMIIFASFTGLSVGRLFAGGVIPGLILSSLFMLYIAIRCFFRPSLGPPVPVEERTNWREKFISLRHVILPILLIISILGSIFSGAATPTEAAAIGAFGSIVCALVSRRLKWQVIKQTCYESLKLTVMVMWILVGAIFFSAIYTAVGGPVFMNELVIGLGVNRWVVLIGMQVVLLILGCMLDPSGIIVITTPVFYPIVLTLGFDGLWYGILFVINMELSFLTPPYGLNLFYLKSIVPEGITMTDIYNSVWPFLALQILGLALVMVFPQLALWLPEVWLG